MPRKWKLVGRFNIECARCGRPGRMVVHRFTWTIVGQFKCGWCGLVRRGLMTAEDMRVLPEAEEIKDRR